MIPSTKTAEKNFPPLKIRKLLRKYKENKSLTGFTLVELLVAIAVFSIIIVVLLGIFNSTIKVQKYSLASQQLTDQISYAMEYISRMTSLAQRDIGGNCTGKPYTSFGSDPFYKLKFYNYRKDTNVCLKFHLNNGRISVDINGTPLPLTSEKFEVKKFEFIISGSGDDDDYQPKVTVSLEIESREGSPKPKMTIQTTVSQKNLDIPR